MTHLLVFLCALVFEAAYLAWVKAAVRGMAVTAGLCSMLIGALSYYNVSSTVRDVGELPYLLAGYFLGSFLIVRLTPPPKQATN